MDGLYYLVNGVNGLVDTIKSDLPGWYQRLVPLLERIETALNRGGDNAVEIGVLTAELKNLLSERPTTFGKLLEGMPPLGDRTKASFDDLDPAERTSAVISNKTPRTLKKITRGAIDALQAHATDDADSETSESSSPKVQDASS